MRKLTGLGKIWLTFGWIVSIFFFNKIWAYFYYRYWGLILAISIAVMTVLMLWKLPRIQVAGLAGLSDEDRFVQEDKARQTLATILGGALLLAGLYSSLETFDLAREGQITDRFSKAVEQLDAADKDGKPKMDVRLGAIYSLGRIADESEKDHWVVLQLLATYVRIHAPRPRGESISFAPSVKQDMKPTPDIQAILDVIGGHDHKYDGIGSLRLDSTDLRGADFIRGNFSDINFRNSLLINASFQNTFLEDSFFSGAVVYNTNFSGAVRLHQLEVEQMYGDNTTILPRGSSRPSDWPTVPTPNSVSTH